MTGLLGEVRRWWGGRGDAGHTPTASRIDSMARTPPRPRKWHGSVPLATEVTYLNDVLIQGRRLHMRMEARVVDAAGQWAGRNGI
jgi:hypothetical protein